MEHHFNVYLCKGPGLKGDVVWNCFGDEFGYQPDLPNGTICEGDDMLPMFANFDTRAQGLTLPDGFAFKARGFKYVVMATHYPEVKDLTNGQTGNSELTMRLLPEDKKRKKVAVFNLSAWGFVPPLSVSSMNGSYVYDQSIPMQELAVLTHTHAKGRDFEVWLTPRNGNRTLLWKQHPNREVYWHFLSQPFRSISDGDTITLRCVFNNTSPEKLAIE